MWHKEARLWSYLIFQPRGSKTKLLEKSSSPTLHNKDSVIWQRRITVELGAAFTPEDRLGDVKLLSGQEDVPHVLESPRNVDTHLLEW
jgi:hypothetical protein